RISKPASTTPLRARLRQSTAQRCMPSIARRPGRRYHSMSPQWASNCQQGTRRHIGGSQEPLFGGKCCAHHFSQNRDFSKILSSRLLPLVLPRFRAGELHHLREREAIAEVRAECLHLRQYAP